MGRLNTWRIAMGSSVRSAAGIIHSMQNGEMSAHTERPKTLARQRRAGIVLRGAAESRRGWRSWLRTGAGGDGMEAGGDGMEGGLQSTHSRGSRWGSSFDSSGGAARRRGGARRSSWPPP